MSDTVIAGIDLGTTYSAIAILNEFGKPEIVQNAEGKSITPSVIHFEDGLKPVVGETAKNTAVMDPLNTCQFIKRQMGKVDQGGKSAVVYEDANDREYTPESLSALILMKLVQDAEAILGKQVGKVVITVPAYFKDDQRNATMNAGRIAGLDVIGIINEPTAAAVAYGFNKQPEKTLLIYDLGGGTFDVTICSFQDNELEVLGTSGDSELGGFNFDNRIMELMAGKFEAEHGKKIEDLSDLQDLRDRAEKAKRSLSNKGKVKLFAKSGGDQTEYDLTRKEFESITKDLLDRTEQLIRRALQEASMSWSDIDDILMVGGSTRMKMVPEMIKRLSGKAPLGDLKVDEVVAKGAVLVTAIKLSESGEDHEITDSEGHQAPAPKIGVQDVCSHTLGVGAIIADIDPKNLSNAPVIEKNTPVPVEVIKREFSLIHPDQTAVRFPVLQGEAYTPHNKCAYIGEINLTGLPPNMEYDGLKSPKEVATRIEISFRYDVDGIIHVSARDHFSGQSTQGRLEHKKGLTKKEVEEERVFLSHHKGEL